MNAHITPRTPLRGALHILAGGLLLGGLLWQTTALWAGEQAVRLPPPAQEIASTGQGPQIPQKAIFAGGCFWGVQGVFQHVKGVQSAVSGYSGGTAAQASYSIVSSGRTQHAESVEITYDPAQVSYGRLLQIFFSVVHDPTQLNRQGPDVGTQYRSAIFATTPAQWQMAQSYVAQLDAARAFARPIVTRLEHQPSFFPAEAYHQDFMTEHPRHPYIVINDLPKVAQLQQLFPDSYRGDPVLVRQGR
ncbi:MAG: peptide-methionine (S)-S-oxide reductase MsrA [Proteobacteria bacterium]|nr:peptide-methionine (S)-S-oxide reductase MsrA [Pseudomonadota bacterium]